MKKKDNIVIRKSEMTEERVIKLLMEIARQEIQKIVLESDRDFNKHQADRFVALSIAAYCVEEHYKNVGGAK